MIRAVFYRTSENFIAGFQISGHAGYDRYGKDIVCAAVSALSINTINSIDQLTTDDFRSEQSDGLLKFRVVTSQDPGTQLLLQSLLMGLQNIESEQGKYIKVIIRTREV